MKKYFLAAWIALSFSLIAGAEEPGSDKAPSGDAPKQSAPADHSQKQVCGKDGNPENCGSNFSWKLPSLEIEGGELKGGLTPWIPKHKKGDGHGPKGEGIGLWAGPTFGIEFLNLGGWLKPMTDSLDIGTFKNNAPLLGFQTELNINDQFVVGGYFEDGFQVVEEEKEGKHRQASINLLRFGGLGEIQVPVVSKTNWENWASQIKVSDTRVLPPEPPRFIGGCRFGASAISLARQDEIDLWGGNEWFLNASPYAGIMIPLHKYVRVHGLVGYDFLQPVSGISDYNRNERPMVSGKEPGGFFLGGGIMFGAQSAPKK